MRLSIVFFCCFAVVFADSYCGQSFPPPKSECISEVQPAPATPVTGLLTQLTQNLSNSLKAEFQQIKSMLLKNNNDLLTFIRETSGPAFNLQEKIEYIQKQSNLLWKYIVDTGYDLNWHFNLNINDDILTIEKQFRLVIEQPLVRSWLRDLRDHTRNGRNRAVAIIDGHRSKSEQLFLRFKTELENLVRSEICQNTIELQKRFYRLVRQYFAELENIISGMEQEIGLNGVNFYQRLFELANNIYEAEMKSLKYFVS